MVETEGIEEGERVVGRGLGLITVCPPLTLHHSHCFFVVWAHHCVLVMPSFCVLIVPSFCVLVVPSFPVLVIWLSHVVAIVLSCVVVAWGHPFVFILGHLPLFGQSALLFGLSLALGIVSRLVWGWQWFSGMTNDD